MKKLVLFAGALVTLVAAVLFTQPAMATETIDVLGRDGVATLSIPAGTSGFILVHEGDGTANFAEVYGPFAKDADASLDQAHYSAKDETRTPVALVLSPDHKSSRDQSRFTLVLDQEEQTGSELPRAAFFLRAVKPTWGDKPHGALDSAFRFEKSIWKDSNVAFTGEIEYAGEQLHGETARWTRTGNSQDDLRVWAGFGGRPRLGTRWSLEGGFGFGLIGAELGSRPVGLRLGFLHPIEPNNWLELGSRTQAMVGLSSATAGEELGADAAWFRWGTRLGQLCLTAGSSAELRYENAFTGVLVPRIGVQWSNPRLGTLRLRIGFAMGTGNGVRTELSITPY